MEEAERLCDRLVIIDGGKVVADDTLQGLHRLMPAASFLTVELGDSGNGFGIEELQRLPEVLSVEMRGNELKVGVRDLSTGTPKILQSLVDGGYTFQHVASERASLETVFLNLTGRSLRD
jgi:ABC-2 type transport system ATP-binding protein